MNISEKAEITASIRHTETYFQKQEHRFTISMLRKGLYEGRKRKTNANKRNNRKFLTGDGSMEQYLHEPFSNEG